MAGWPVYSLDQIIDRLDSGNRWEQSVITYTVDGFPRSGKAYSYSDGIVRMTPQQSLMAELAFSYWNDLIAPTIRHAHDRDADISFNYTSQLAGVATGETEDDAISEGWANIWISSKSALMNKDLPDFYGSYQFETYLHEIGHALGLDHPGNYNALFGAYSTYAESALFYQDTWQYTIMSYFREKDAQSGADYMPLGEAQNSPQTPMLYDVAAIQAMYGADLQTRLGDTVYGFNSSFPTFGVGAVYNFDVNKNPILTIYDAGGNDTLDVSGFSLNQIIDLMPGHYSSIGALKQNVAMAFNATSGAEGNPNFNPDAVIENAIGGSGNDVIGGNDARNFLVGNAGNDELNGGLGGDWLLGGAGNDTYVVQDADDQVLEVVFDPTGSFEYDAGGTDIVYSMLPDYALPEAVENLTLYSGRNGTGNGLFNSITGNGQENYLDGRGGDDWLIGDGGADWLIGGEGADGMDGGDGEDQFVVDNGNETGGDVVVGGDGQDEIWADSSVAATGLRLNLFATGTPYTADVNLVPHTSAALDVELVHGSSVGGDVIDGSRLTDEGVGVEGYGGADLFISGGGMDVFDGGADTDTIAYMGMPSNFTVKAVDGHDGWFIIEDRSSGVTDIIHDVEIAMFGDGSSVNVAEWARASEAPVTPAGLTLIGTAAGDTLTGGDGNDRLEGGDGMDFLTGGAGADQLLAGAGTDFLYVDADDTLIDGGEGFDYVYLDSSKPYGATFNVAGTNVEYVGGTLADDVIDASSVAYRTVLFGNYGNDVLIGGAGNDGLLGSVGDDTLTGGGGNDTFYFGSLGGSDTVTDFIPGQDVLDLTAVSGLTGMSQLAITDTAAGASIAFGGDSILLQGVAAGSLSVSDFHFLL